jgi:hypothetical protein
MDRSMMCSTFRRGSTLNSCNSCDTHNILHNRRISRCLPHQFLCWDELMTTLVTTAHLLALGQAHHHLRALGHLLQLVLPRLDSIEQLIPLVVCLILADNC